MKELFKDKQNLFILLAILIVCIASFYFIIQKEGFHEDEIFSYGSSNYKYDNNFQPGGKMDTENRLLYKYVWKDNIIDSIKAYREYRGDNGSKKEEFDKEMWEIVASDKPVWKTKEEAHEYLTVQKDEKLSYNWVWFNQKRDVHPPLFYFVVHFVSSIFTDTFSKYIIFSINLIFEILTCLMICKILKLLSKKELAAPCILLYGLSMGALSTVLFLRMYSMLTFFGLWYLYINLKIYKNDFSIDKKDGIQLVAATVLGFLTQYYFCVIAVGVFIVFAIYLLTHKEFKKLFEYVMLHALSAAIGIVLFQPSIKHIFYSYRGLGNDNKSNIFELIKTFYNRLAYSFSINEYLLLVILLAIIGFSFYDIVKNKNRFLIVLFIVVISVYYLVISKLSPTLDLNGMVRYLTPILPIVAIVLIFGIDKIGYEIFKSTKLSKAADVLKLSIIYGVVVIVSILGLLISKPTFLYKGYNEVLEVAKENSTTPYIYIFDNSFTHLSNIQEFLIYDKSLIFNINHDKYEDLKDDEVIKNEDEFIVCIKPWINVEENLQKILEATNCKNFELLYNDRDNNKSVIYKITKN